MWRDWYADMWNISHVFLNLIKFSIKFRDWIMISDAYRVLNSDMWIISNAFLNLITRDLEMWIYINLAHVFRLNYIKKSRDASYIDTRRRHVKLLLLLKWRKTPFLGKSQKIRIGRWARNEPKHHKKEPKYSLAPHLCFPARLLKTPASAPFINRGFTWNL